MQFQQIEDRLSRIENKLDSHLERVSKVEIDVGWLKGHAKVVTTIGISIIATAILIGLGLK